MDSQHHPGFNQATYNQLQQNPYFNQPNQVPFPAYPQNQPHGFQNPALSQFSTHQTHQFNLYAQNPNQYWTQTPQFPGSHQNFMPPYPNPMMGIPPGVQEQYQQLQSQIQSELQSQRPFPPYGMPGQMPMQNIRGPIQGQQQVPPQGNNRYQNKPNWKGNQRQQNFKNQQGQNPNQQQQGQNPNQQNQNQQGKGPKNQNQNPNKDKQGKKNKFQDEIPAHIAEQVSQIGSSPEEVAAYIAQRKAKFPTKAAVEQKQKDREERIARGELVDIPPLQKEKPHRGKKGRNHKERNDTLEKLGMKRGPQAPLSGDHKRMKFDPSLLEKLLSNHQQQEREALLQCFHYIVSTNFFGEGIQSTSENAPTEEPIFDSEAPEELPNCRSIIVEIHSLHPS